MTAERIALAPNIRQFLDPINLRDCSELLVANKAQSDIFHGNLLEWSQVPRKNALAREKSASREISRVSIASLSTEREFVVSEASGGSDMRHRDMLLLGIGVFASSLLIGSASPGRAEEPDLIFRKSTDIKLLTPNDKLATYVLDDPDVEGVACSFTVHEKGGVAGLLGVAEQTSDVSLSCRQYGPIKFKEKFSQGSEVFSERRSFLWKRMHIVRGCDAKRNTLIYMAYSDRLIKGSPQNSTSSIPIQPWNGSETTRCADFLKD